MNEQRNVENNLEEVPLLHYCELFRAADPEEMSRRTGTAWDGSAFTIRLLDSEYRITWPEYSVTAACPEAIGLKQLPAQTFLLRYLLEGRQAGAFSDFKTFRELPWGNVYIKPFTGRCITRAAYAFGTKLAAFRSGAAALGGEACSHGDASFRFELLPGFFMELIVWEGDDEFPPNSQILYSSNFAEAFSAEDRVKAGDILITAIKQKM